MRLSHKQLSDSYHEYAQTVSCLQGLAEVYRDVMRRTYYHVRENHKGLLSIQRQELEQITREALRLLEMVEGHIAGEARLDLKIFEKERESLDNFIKEFSILQNERIHNHSSKTRLSLLYFALCDDFKRLIDHLMRIQEIAQRVQIEPDRKPAAPEKEQALL